MDLMGTVALAAGDEHAVYLTATESAEEPSDATMELVMAQIPSRVNDLHAAANDDLLAELDRTGPLHDAATELSGSKAMLRAVLDLGLSQTMEQDDVLHGFLYGDESIGDLNGVRGLFQTEQANLQAEPNRKLMILEEILWPRFQRFAERLQQRLIDLEQTGQPEIPRQVQLTLWMLERLRDSKMAAVQPPTLEIARQGQGLEIMLFGDPYGFYTLQESFNLTSWSDTSVTNLRSVDTPVGVLRVVNPDPAEPSQFYQAIHPQPQ
jgi:hypothetical protein